jgi:hypothetical protein
MSAASEPVSSSCRPAPGGEENPDGGGRILVQAGNVGGRSCDPSTLESIVPTWKPGDSIYLGHWTLRVVGIRDDDTDQPPAHVPQRCAGLRYLGLLVQHSDRRVRSTAREKMRPYPRHFGNVSGSHRWAALEAGPLPQLRLG